jgi:uncharacterized protein (TIGR00369 family)
MRARYSTASVAMFSESQRDGKLSKNPMSATPGNSADRVRADAAKQEFLRLLGTELTHVAPGEVEFSLPYRNDLTQQHGFVHAGVITTLADVACGYAAFSLMPEGSEVLSVEFKVNLLRPAAGTRFIARARVLKSGQTLTVAQADVFAATADGEKQVATMLATMIRK